MDEGKTGIKTKEEWKEHHIKRIDFLLNNFSNEIPEEMKRGGTEEIHYYKVRGNWFAAVQNLIDYSFSQKLLPEDFQLECKNFFSDYRTRHNSIKIRTNKEEIDKADDLLKRAKEFIKNN